MRNQFDLTGQRFGMLTVLEPFDKPGKYQFWLCRCDCGKELPVRASHLRTGHTKSCGCQGNGSILDRLTFVDGTCVEMLKNKKLRRNNTSGTTGVYWVESIGRWRAAICFKGKRKIIGQFTRYEDAVRARREAEGNLHDRFLETFSKESTSNSVLGSGQTS